MWFRDAVESKGGNSYFKEDIETVLWKKRKKKKQLCTSKTTAAAEQQLLL